MKKIWFVLALLCAACASQEKVADDAAYQPPVYRTGSNIPVQGGIPPPTEESIRATQDALRQTILPHSGPAQN